MKRRCKTLVVFVTTACLSLVCLGFGASQARARERFSIENVDVGSIDLLDAIVEMQTVLGRNCHGRAVPATGSMITWDCDRPNPSVDLHYRDFPSVTWQGDRWFTLRRQDNSVGAGLAIDYASIEEVRRLAGMWVALAQPRSPPDPATDSQFQAALSNSSTTDSESLRRVQVQVEAALRANRNIDAARLYRDALRTSPGWADGHYNLGLLYGDLELFPEAITEMRRYLYLTPNAQDARAVQDKIYEWEAAMTVH